MANNAVYEWDIYCETEAAWVTGYGPTEITVCPTNTAHTVTAGSVTKLRQYSSQTTKIIEFEPAVGQKSIAGAKKLLTVVLRDDAANTTSLRELHVSKMVWTSPPHPTVVQCITSNSEASQKGDVVNLWVNKHKAVGLLGAAMTQDTAIITVATPDYFTGNAVTGLEIAVEDETGIVDLGVVTEINTANHTITVSVPALRTFAQGSVLRMGVHTIDTVVLGSSGSVDFGQSTPSAIGYLAPSTPVTIWYENVHARPTTWQVQLTLGYGTK